MGLLQHAITRHETVGLSGRSGLLPTMSGFRLLQNKVLAWHLGRAVLPQSTASTAWRGDPCQVRDNHETGTAQVAEPLSLMFAADLFDGQWGLRPSRSSRSRWHRVGGRNCHVWAILISRRASVSLP